MISPSQRALRATLRRSSMLARPALIALCGGLAAFGSAQAQSPHHGHAQHRPQVQQTEMDLSTINVQASSFGSGEGAGADDLFLPLDAATIDGIRARNATLSTSDSGSLLNGVPGGASWGAGGVSSLPAINGMGADRVQIAINDMIFGVACPNEMNPPLSFVNPAMISSMTVYTATAPVSVGGDYTGAKVDVEMAPPKFSAGSQMTTSGSVAGFYRSNGNAYGTDVTATMSNSDTSITYTGGWARAGDYTAGDGTKIKSTMYETQNHALSISKRDDSNLFTVQLGGQFIPSQGYPNQYMDLIDNKSFFINGRYEGQFDWGQLEASAFFSRVRHTMGFIGPDKTGDMPMDTRTTNIGYNVKAIVNLSQHDVLRVGNEVAYTGLDDWWPPVEGSIMMGPDTFLTINDGRRTRIGTFAEWERHLSNEWTAILGIRNDIVLMNTGDVQGYNAMMYGAAAAAFNAQDHARTDFNIDGSAILRYTPDQSSQYELGLSRKTRSPNLYERYTWSTNAMAMSMIGWFGDGNGYVGNLDLEPEKAHSVSFTASWHDPAQKVWSLRVSPYVSYVQDYIDADRCALAGCLSAKPDNLTAVDSFVYLQFANHDAWLYGVNIDGKLALWDGPDTGRGVLRGSLNFVRGERTDGVNLYHMMPLNGTLALDHTLGNWTTTVEVQMVGAKTEVSQVRNEIATSAYALLNLRTAYDWQTVRVDFGIDNVLDTNYGLPLGGANLVNYQAASMMGTSPIWGYEVAGPGRSINARVTVRF
ncbi:TonB-dependent receptor [Xanthobacteraceae bacterium A53D]